MQRGNLEMRSCDAGHRRQIPEYSIFTRVI